MGADFKVFQVLEPDKGRALDELRVWAAELSSSHDGWDDPVVKAAARPIVVHGVIHPEQVLTAQQVGAAHDKFAPFCALRVGDPSCWSKSVTYVTAKQAVARATSEDSALAAAAVWAVRTAMNQGLLAGEGEVVMSFAVPILTPTVVEDVIDTVGWRFYGWVNT